MKLQNCRNCCSDEIETTITMMGNGADGFRVYTCSAPMIYKISKFLDEPNTPWSLEKIAYNNDGTPSGYFFKCSIRNCLQLKAKKAAVREMTEEEKEAAAVRLAASRPKKRS